MICAQVGRSAGFAFVGIEVTEEIDNALRNRLRYLFTERRGAQQLLFLMVCDERGFHQNRRDRRGFQYRERRLFGLLTVQVVDRTDAVEHMVAERQAVFNSIGLHQIE